VYSLSEDGIPVNRTSFFSSLKKGDSLVIQDGKYQFTVIEASASAVKVKAVNSGQIKSRARINVPGVKIEMGTLTERDLKFIDAGTKSDVDFYALSFVQSREDMWKLEDSISAAGGLGKTVSKIETKSGYAEIAAIAHSSDMVMVARGDLGVELPISEVAVAQKRIICETHREGIPAIVATQMLESMVQNDVPTRAEVSDVTNAIFDNCDVVMTSEETAIGKYPAMAVSYLREISEYAENAVKNLPEPDQFLGNQIAYSVCKAAKVMAEKISAKHIVVFTKSGSTARMMSSLRPEAEIVAVVTSASLARKLFMVRGVKVALLPAELEKSIGVIDAIKHIEPMGIFKAGEDVVVASGAPYFLFGGTNDVRVVTIGEFIARGYPEGDSVKGRCKLGAGGKGEILFSDYIPDVIDSGTKVVVTTKFLTASIRARLRDQGISSVILTQVARYPRENEMLSVNCLTGVITSLESAK
jgi:pyruvate kinase